MAYQIQYRGVWAGAESRDWSPAVTGTLNQSNDSDIFASTFNDLDVARAFLEDEIFPVADDRVEFRIVEIPTTFDRDGANVTPEAAWDSLSDLVAVGDFDGLAAIGKLASERISAGDNVNRWSAVQDATTVSAALLTLDLSDSSSGALREILLLGLTFIIRRWELINGAS